MKLRQENKDLRIFVWTTLNALIAFGITQFSWLEGDNAVVVTGLLIPFLNILSKLVNTKLLGDLWVNDKN